MCPGNVVEDAINAFASACERDVDGGQFDHVCVNCTEGHAGDHCEVCENTWYGTPEDITVSTIDNFVVVKIWTQSFRLVYLFPNWLEEKNDPKSVNGVIFITEQSWHVCAMCM